MNCPICSKIFLVEGYFNLFNVVDSFSRQPDSAEACKLGVSSAHPSAEQDVIRPANTLSIPVHCNATLDASIATRVIAAAGLMRTPKLL
jgi:hypothetical protein